MLRLLKIAVLVFVGVLAWRSWGAESDYPVNVYWGDTHLHTNLSLDAYGRNELELDDASEFRHRQRGELLDDQPDRGILGLGGAERDEECHGQGTMTYADGRLQVGQFEDGRYLRTAVEDRIYNACIMDKGEDQDMSLEVVRGRPDRRPCPSATIPRCRK